MYRKEICPLVGERCSHEPIAITPNSFFLIQPFDDQKKKREDAINQVLNKYLFFLLVRQYRINL